MRSAIGPRVDDGTVAVEARRRPNWIRRHVMFLVGLDAGAAVAATGVARLVRFGTEPVELLVRSVSIPYSLFAVLLVPTWLCVLALGRCYDVGPFASAVRSRQVVRAGANFMAVVAVVYFVLQVKNLGRGFLALAVTFAVGFSLVLRAATVRYLRNRRREGRGVRRALVVGSRPTVAAVVRRLELRRGAELRAIGACVPDPGTPMAVNERDLPIHGGLDDVLPAIEASGADAVVLTGSLANGRIQRLTWALERTGIDVFVVPALTQQAVDLDIRPVAGLPLVYVNEGRAPLDLGEASFKGDPGQDGHNGAPRTNGSAATNGAAARNGASANGSANATTANGTATTKAPANGANGTASAGGSGAEGDGLRGVTPRSTAYAGRRPAKATAHR